MDRSTNIIDPEGDVIVVLKDPNAPFPGLPGSFFPAREDKEGYRFRCSAKHLTLASPVIRTILSSKWKDSEEFKRKGYIPLIMKKWNVYALEVLLNILHCRLTEVPRRLSLLRLTQLAMIADHYGCLDQLVIFQEVWIPRIKPCTVYKDPSFMMWFWITWVFKLPEAFEEATLDCVEQSGDTIEAMCIPIPEEIIESLNEKREGYIEHVVDAMVSTYESATEGDEGCSEECNRAICKAIDEGMRSISISSIMEVEAPYQHIVFEKICEAAQSIEASSEDCRCVKRSLKSLRHQADREAKPFYLGHFPRN